MKTIRTLAISVALLGALGTATFAAGDELPARAYDMVAEVTFATTADAQCDGIKSRPGQLQKYIVNMYGELAKVGVSATDASEHFATDTAMAQIAARDVVLRAKHGVAAEGSNALCTAIRAEGQD